MTSSVVARRRGLSFTIAELIGTDTDEDDDADAGNHGNRNDDCDDVRQVAWQHQQQLTSGAFQIYRPSSVANGNGNFYQACLEWMRRRGTILRKQFPRSIHVVSGVSAEDANCSRGIPAIVRSELPREGCEG